MVKRIYDVIKKLFGINTDVFKSTSDISKTMIKSVKPDSDSC